MQRIFSIDSAYLFDRGSERELHELCPKPLWLRQGERSGDASIPMSLLKDFGSYRTL